MYTVQNCYVLFIRGYLPEPRGTLPYGLFICMGGQEYTPKHAPPAHALVKATISGASFPWPSASFLLFSRVLSGADDGFN